ncbi:unnamed protein product [Oncorhynchus mykiss]|uniref:Uncharacterized protein n=1 Tax=Oncorhynchus mykiss TaxID=8022 RepID=A0A060W7Z6_ONCMY|nr:unnamed protein product [Oncorhynchus mykiss]
MSSLAFMRILEQRTDFFGRNGMIYGDTFQKSFFEWTYCRSEIDQVCDIQDFDCPACSPSMLTVSVDGNKKLYRFKKGYVKLILIYQISPYSCSKTPNGSTSWSSSPASPTKGRDRDDLAYRNTGLGKATRRRHQPTYY